jgi:hypothetical protein
VGFVEVDLGTRNAVEGYFDAAGFANATGTDAAARQSISDELTSEGFVTGYGRQWYQPKKSDWLYEVVMVFRDRTSASAAASWNKVEYARSSSFDAFVDVHLNSNAYALTETIQDFQWTVVVFTRSNDMFVIARGSNADYMTDRGLAQAQRAYSQAPNGTALPQQSPPTAAFAKYIRPVAIVGLVGALMLAAALGVIVFVVFAPRIQPKP